MLVSEISTRVKRQFGDENDSQITDADIIRWVNDAMQEIASASNLLQISASTATTAGVADYALPTDLLKLRSVKYKGVKLTPTSMEDSDNNIGNDTTSVPTGTPTQFYVFAGSLHLYPAPSATGTTDLKVYYTRQPVAVTAVGNTPELPVQYHPRIVEYCIAQAAELDDNLNQYLMKMNQFKDGVSALTTDHNDERDDVYPSITVSPSDYGLN